MREHKRQQTEHVDPTLKALTVNSTIYRQYGEPNTCRCHGQLGFAGNDSPSFVFPTAIATKGPSAGTAGTGSGRPAVANKPNFLTGGAGPGGHLSAKRGTEDLDFFIGDEALNAAAGPGMLKKEYEFGRI
ncbi:hypothetical protein MRB53_042087 [Persea americana]|nr:hypothetical protein MRB53_042087 [Persea americana]